MYVLLWQNRHTLFAFLHRYDSMDILEFLFVTFQVVLVLVITETTASFRVQTRNVITVTLIRAFVEEDVIQGTKVIGVN